LTKFAHLVQFKRVFMSCLGDWGPGTLPPLGYATACTAVSLTSTNLVNETNNM